MDPILTAIENLGKQIKSNHDEFTRVMFGPKDKGGRGGIVKCLNDLETTVCGIPGSEDDRGLVGDMKDIDRQINGKDGMAHCVARMKESQRIWNGGLTLGQAGTLAIAAIKNLFTGGGT